MGGTSRMSREAQVRIWERLRVQLPGPTQRLCKNATVLRDNLVGSHRDDAVGAWKFTFRALPTVSLHFTLNRHNPSRPRRSGAFTSKDREKRDV
jgi:hypothetical protein